MISLQFIKRLTGSALPHTLLPSGLVTNQSDLDQLCESMLAITGSRTGTIHVYADESLYCMVVIADDPSVSNPPCTLR